MSKKLLDKTLQVYIVFAIVVLLVCAPLFFVLTNRLFKHEADEQLFLKKDEFIRDNLPGLKESDIAIWNKINRDTKIEEYHPIRKKDRLSDRHFRDTLDHEDVPYRVLQVPVVVDGKPKVFVTRVSLIETEALAKNIGILFCIILIALLTGLYIITRVLSKKIWRPFFLTIEELEKFDLSKNAVPEFRETNTDEFDRLNRSADKLLRRNLLVFKNQKEFIENAAHELQTPLALFMAKLDLLVQQVPLTKELSDALSSLQESATRIVRLNKNLLLLSKIDNEQYSSYSRVAVNTIVEKQCDFLREQLAEKNVTLQMDHFEPLMITANLTLVEVAVTNLLLNALRHNLINGFIVVQLEQGKLTVKNSGIEALKNTNNLYQRFVASTTTGGSGLGLAIVSKISSQHQWHLSYAFENNMHSFQIAF